MEKEQLTALGEMRQRIMEIMALGLSGTEVDPELAYETLAQYHRADHKYLAVVHKTLTTGSDTGRKGALSAFSANVKVSKKKDFEYTRAEAETARDRLLKLWCCGNVAEATGNHEPDTLFSHMNFAVSRMNMYRSPHYNAEHTEAYWYGMATLMSIIHPEDDEDLMLDDGGKFIMWAGDRTDLREVVRIGCERETIDPAVIEGIMANEARVAGSIKDGVL